MSADQHGPRFRIADALNTYNAALTVIRGKGYSIHLVPDEREEFLGDFWAIGDGRDFIASDPLRLLGLIGLWEQLGDEWRERSDAGIYNEILDTAFARDGFAHCDDTEFRRVVADFSTFFEALGLPPLQSVSREELTRRVLALSEELAHRDDDEPA